MGCSIAKSVIEKKWDERRINSDAFLPKIFLNENKKTHTFLEKLISDVATPRVSGESSI